MLKDGAITNDVCVLGAGACEMATICTGRGDDAIPTAVKCALSYM